MNYFVIEATNLILHAFVVKLTTVCHLKSRCMCCLGFWTGI